MDTPHWVRGPAFEADAPWMAWTEWQLPEELPDMTGPEADTASETGDGPDFPEAA